MELLPLLPRPLLLMQLLLLPLMLIPQMLLLLLLLCCGYCWRAATAAVARLMEQPSSQGTFCVCDLSRDPDMTFGPNARVDDSAVCLTASNSYLWVFALGEGADGLLSCDRALKMQERAALQGFPAASRVQRRHAVRIYGNAMSVPAVGGVLFVGIMMMTDYFASISRQA